MDTSFSFVLKCPHCGTIKRVGQRIMPKGRPCMWSDGRFEVEGVQFASRTQQCPECRHFYIMCDKTITDTEDEFTESRGVLPFNAYKQALAELKLTPEEEDWVRMEAWQAYNKLYNDIADEDIPADDYEFNQKNMNWLLFYQLTHTQSSLFIFEFLRLTGQDDKYLKFMEDYTFELFVIEEQRDRGIPEEDRAEDLKENEEEYRAMYDEFMTSRKELFNQPRRVFKVYA